MGNKGDLLLKYKRSTEKDQSVILVCADHLR